MRALIMHMIQLDPAARLTAKEYLTSWGPSLFPDYFTSFLQPFCHTLLPMNAGLLWHCCLTCTGIFSCLVPVSPPAALLPRNAGLLCHCCLAGACAWSPQQVLPPSWHKLQMCHTVDTAGQHFCFAVRLCFCTLLVCLTRLLIQD